MIKRVLILTGILVLGFFAYFTLHEQAGEKIVEEVELDLPEEIAEIVNDPYQTWDWVTTPDERYIIYFDIQALEPKLNSYDKETGKIGTLMSLYDDVGGFSIIGWNPSGTKLAIAAMNWEREDYPDISKLFVLEIEEGILEKKDKYNFVFAFECDDRGCFYFDIDWKSDTELEYRTWDLPGGTPYDTAEDPSYQRIFKI